MKADRTNGTETLGLSSAADFKQFKADYFADVTLPSGLRARLRPVDATLFATMGKIPDLLTTQIAEEMTGKQLMDVTKLDVGQLMKMTQELQYAVACAAFVIPEVRMSPKDDQLHPSDLIQEDLEYVLQFQNMGIDTLKSFRNQPEGHVALVVAEQDDGPASE